MEMTFSIVWDFDDFFSRSSVYHRVWLSWHIVFSSRSALTDCSRIVTTCFVRSYSCPLVFVNDTHDRQLCHPSTSCICCVLRSAHVQLACRVTSSIAIVICVIWANYAFDLDGLRLRYWSDFWRLFFWSTHYYHQLTADLNFALSWI